MNDKKDFQEIKQELKQSIYDGIENQINKMDNKAGLLISALEIVFALSMEFLSVYKLEGFHNFKYSFKIVCYITTILYCTSFLMSIVMFISTIYPRKNKKQKGKNKESFHVNYYYDLSKKINIENRSEIFNNALEKEINSKGNNLENQIFTNADICRKKHDRLVIGITSLIPFFLAMFIFIVLFIIGNNY